MLLNAHAGAKYGIPFPVLARAPFGVLGANVPAILRALVACGWFGIQTWIGGQAINAMLRILWPAWDLAGHSNHQVSGRDRRAVHAGDRNAAAVVGDAQGRRLRPGAERAQPLPRQRRLLAFLRPGADGHGGAEHTRLLALCPLADSADAGAGAGAAHGHDAVFLHRRGGDVGIGGDLRRGDSGPLPSARRGLRGADRAAAGHAEYQRGGQRGVAIERFFEPESAAHFVSHRRTGSRDAWVWR